MCSNVLGFKYIINCGWNELTRVKMLRYVHPLILWSSSTYYLKILFLQDRKRTASPLKKTKSSPSVVTITTNRLVIIRVL